MLQISARTLFSRHRAGSVALLLAALLAGCATPGAREPHTEERAYRAVTEAVAREDCPAARDATREMEAAYPDSRRLPDAYLEASYVCLRMGEFEAAEMLAVSFLERFPGHPAEDYGRYLNALTAYAHWRSLPPGTPVARSAAEARKAFARFRVLMINHPDTGYAPDVRPILVDLREGLAKIELDAIRGDLTAQRHAAVIPRARYLLTYYRQTESAPYALAALVSAHRAQGDTAAANRTLQQLESDWPGHPVLQNLR
jgi:outer membrane protein assembly factor BamD